MELGNGDRSLLYLSTRVEDSSRDCYRRLLQRGDVKSVLGVDGKSCVFITINESGDLSRHVQDSSGRFLDGPSNVLNISESNGNPAAFFRRQLLAYENVRAVVHEANERGFLDILRGLRYTPRAIYLF